MAQSRLQKFASIFNRVEGFLKAGVIKFEDKPIWFDVYKCFPPAKDPVFLQPLPETKVRPILYHEDKIRAEFYRVFGSPGIIELNDPSKIPVSELFIENYIEIAKSTTTDVEDVVLFNLAANRLREDGIKLRKYSGSDTGLDSKSKPNVKNYVNMPSKGQKSLNVTGLMEDE